MPTTLPESELVRLLPGSWTVAATNFPMWLTGKRLEPVLNYEIVTEKPLVFKDVVRYTTDTGEAKSIVGVDKYRGRGFTWRGKGLLGLVASHWLASGANSEGTVLAIQYEKTLFTPAGIDIIVREGVDVPEVRTIVATDAAAYGLTLEKFASLTWMHGVK